MNRNILLGGLAALTLATATYAYDLQSKIVEELGKKVSISMYAPGILAVEYDTNSDGWGDLKLYYAVAEVDKGAGDITGVLGLVAYDANNNHIYEDTERLDATKTPSIKKDDLIAARFR